MIFTHIRPPKVSVVNKKGKSVLSNQSSMGITVCCRPSETRADGQWALVGASFHPPGSVGWDRKKACAIAEARAFDSPLQFQFEGLDDELAMHHVASALRTLSIEEPRWGFADAHPLRPSRFSQRFGVALLGPGSSLLTAYVDVRPKPSDQEGKSSSRKVIYIHQSAAEKTPISISHWALRIPTWARKLLLETQ